MPAKIQPMPRRPIASRTKLASVVQPPAFKVTAPPLHSVDAVVEWLNQINLQSLAIADTAPMKHKALQVLIAAFGRCRAAARDVELLLRAREQREGIPATMGEQAPLSDPLAMPLWHSYELARLIKLVADADDLDKDDVKSIQTRIKHHVAGVQVREAGVSEALKRKHRLGSNVAAAVEGYAAIQAQLEKEALTAGDALDERWTSAIK